MGSLALSIQSINSYSSYMRSETPICSTEMVWAGEIDLFVNLLRILVRLVTHMQKDWRR
jgi:hypothetical protein